MKKLIIAVLIAVMIPVIALADVDLASMSFEELKALQQAINEEIVKRPEWKEVIVPSGKWIVGKDIPAGDYSIKPYGGGAFLTVENPEGGFGRLVVNQGVRNSSNSIGKVILEEGYIVTVETGSLIFAPAIGLGF